MELDTSTSTAKDDSWSTWVLEEANSAFLGASTLYSDGAQAVSARYGSAVKEATTLIEEGRQFVDSAQKTADNYVGLAVDSVQATVSEYAPKALDVYRSAKQFLPDYAKGYVESAEEMAKSVLRAHQAGVIELAETFGGQALVQSAKNFLNIDSEQSFQSTAAEFQDALASQKIAFTEIITPEKRSQSILKPAPQAEPLNYSAAPIIEAQSEPVSVSSTDPTPMADKKAFSPADVAITSPTDPEKSESPSVFSVEETEATTNATPLHSPNDTQSNVVTTAQSIEVAVEASQRVVSTNGEVAEAYLATSSQPVVAAGRPPLGAVVASVRGLVVQENARSAMRASERSKEVALEEKTSKQNNRLEVPVSQKSVLENVSADPVIQSDLTKEALTTPSADLASTALFLGVSAEEVKLSPTSILPATAQTVLRPANMPSLSGGRSFQDSEGDLVSVISSLDAPLEEVHQGGDKGGDGEQGRDRSTEMIATLTDYLEENWLDEGDASLEDEVYIPSTVYEPSGVYL